MKETKNIAKPIFLGLVMTEIMVFIRFILNISTKNNSVGELIIWISVLVTTTMMFCYKNLYDEKK